MKRQKLANLVAILLVCIISSVCRVEGTVLYERSSGMLKDGDYGPIKRFQTALNAALMACGRRERVHPDGKYGDETITGIRAYLYCPAAAQIPVNDPSRKGKISLEMWKNLIPGGAVPDLNSRTLTLVLTYENTDYSIIAWNFCQSTPRYEPDKPGSLCYSNDKKSFLTWGPRGATAGHGREIQGILWLLLRDRPDLIKSSFGEEFSYLRRFIGLSEQSTQKMLCAVWRNPVRREAWRLAFAKLGANEFTRDTFNRYYQSTISDGGKIARLYRLYELAGLTPSEVDYAFFVDRATHSTVPSSEALTALAAKMKTFVAPFKNNKNAYARLLISRELLAPNTNRIWDRRGRDMAFILGILRSTGTLKDQEIQDWERRGRYLVSDVGLSDTISAPPFTPVQLDLTGMPKGTDELNDDERNNCPYTVLNPRSPT